MKPGWWQGTDSWDDPLVESFALQEVALTALFDSLYKRTDGLSSGTNGLNSTLQPLVVTVFITGSFITEVQA